MVRNKNDISGTFKLWESKVSVFIQIFDHLVIFLTRLSYYNVTTRLADLVGLCWLAWSWSHHQKGLHLPRKALREPILSINFKLHIFWPILATNCEFLEHSNNLQWLKRHTKQRNILKHRSKNISQANSFSNQHSGGTAERNCRVPSRKWIDCGE